MLILGRERLLRASLALAALSACALLAAGPGARVGLWHFRTGFSLLRWGAYGGLAAAALGALALLLRARPRGPGVAGLLLGLACAAAPFGLLRSARSYPAIHDVSTDLADPPLFEDVLPLRAGAPNPAAPGGPEVAASQRAAYPDLAPIELPHPPDECFRRAAAAARGLGWSVVAEAPAEGRLEAVDTTLWFGFKDDVVVRVRAAPSGCRVDARSVSRVGKGDAGANAARLRRFRDRLR